MPIPSPIPPWHQRISGFGAAGHLTHHGSLTALRFRSERSRTYGFHQTPPRGRLSLRTAQPDPVLRTDALASSVSGSLRQGPRTGLAST